MSFTIERWNTTWYMREVERQEWLELSLRDGGFYFDLTDSPYRIQGEGRPSRRRFAFVAQGDRDTLFALQVTKSRALRFFVGSLVPFPSTPSGAPDVTSHD